MNNNIKSVRGSVLVAGKSYSHTITPTKKHGSDMIHFECAGAGIDQVFLPKDLMTLLQKLPNVIIEEQSYQLKESTRMNLRLLRSEKVTIEKRAEAEGKTMTEFVLSKALS